MKMLSIICLSLIQSYSFANESTNDKVADEYIYNQNGPVTVCHYNDKIEEKLCFDENGVVDYGDIYQSYALKQTVK
ncbi:hypothetical protein [Candidatus Arsenophonus nilaparvatae]|uniref:hypothetical protein n=1 Tax=Candidatus Arsenophonus nilaparvatae TaxID=1247023 RepID=UPI0011DD983D|nr:hypothetical protein [Candidatus Arsenophonus nilaparvatae]